MSRTRIRPTIEFLEAREVPSAVTVRADQMVRVLNDDVFGVNVNSWDGVISGDNGTQTTPDAGTVNLLKAAGIGSIRISNGSGSDSWHFNQRYDGQFWFSGAGVLANLTAAAQAEGIVCVNYGTGTPKEAAAYLAYLNGMPSNASALGVDANARDWGTAGQWAALRGQSPLAVDDGLNHLRIGRAAPFGFKYFEVGNEAYFGAWQGYVMPSPQTYGQFSAAFAQLAQSIDPNAKVGVGVGNPIEWDAVWNGPVLTACASNGFTPAFLSDHFYVYDGNTGDVLTDQNLLAHSVSDPASQMPNYHSNSPRNWAGRATAYRSLLQSRLGAAAANVQLIVGEFNIDADAATRQGTNLAGGLWLADALGSLIQTEYAAATFWNLRNNYAAVPAVAGISGWRTGGDDGMVGVGFTAFTPPTTGPYVAYPTYFALQIASKLGRTGDLVIPVTSDTPGVAAYAVKKQDGRISLLLINKSPSVGDVSNVRVVGFTPSGATNQWRYGQTEDDAQRQSANGTSALSFATPQLAITPNLDGGSFSAMLPAYSMTLLDLAPNTNPPATGGLYSSPTMISSPNLGPHTTVMAVGKFNTDDFLDIAVTNYGSGLPNTISILLGNGDGTFQTASKVSLDSPAAATGRHPEGIVALDFDRDGDLDLAVAMYDPNPGNVVILRNNGSGVFTIDQSKSAATSPTHIAAGDFDGDGYPDLAVSVFEGGVQILRNAATIFSPAASVLGSGGTGSNQLVAMDLDGDGDLDIAAANQGNATIGVLANNGSGGFTLARTLTSSGSGTTFLTAADVTYDGLAELYASNTFGNSISIFRNDGGLNFTRTADPVVGNTPTGIAARDLNGDGLGDLVVGVESKSQIAVLMGVGDGTFLDPVYFASIAGNNGVAVADFTRDGQPDLISSQYVSGDKLALLRNALVPTSIAVTDLPIAVTVGSPVILKATVTSGNGSTVTSGYISFQDGVNYLGTANVVNGVAQLTVGSFAIGSHSIQANYGDPRGLTWNGSQSAPGMLSTTPTVPPPLPPTTPTTPTTPLPDTTPSTPFTPNTTRTSNSNTTPTTTTTSPLKSLLTNSVALGANGQAQLLAPDRSVLLSVTPFAGFSGEVRVGSADFNGDGVADLIAGTGPGRATRVIIIDGKTQAELFAVNPFEANFTGGVYVAAGDISGDGIADLLILPDEGGGPRVRIFSGNDFSQLADFFGIDDPNFRGGARAAVGDVNGDGRQDLIVVAGFGGGPRVAIFDGSKLGPNGGPKLVGDFFVFEDSVRNGVFVTAGDVNGDGFAEVVVGGGPGGGPRVSVIDGQSLRTRGVNDLVRTADFFAGDAASRGGVRLAVKDLDGDARADLVTGAGPGSGARATAYAGAALTGSNPPVLYELDGFTGGVFVG